MMLVLVKSTSLLHHNCICKERIAMGPLDVIVVDSHQLQMVLYGNRPIVDIVAIRKLATSKK